MIERYPFLRRYLTFLPWRRRYWFQGTGRSGETAGGRPLPRRIPACSTLLVLPVGALAAGLLGRVLCVLLWPG